ncbi:MAG TPA: TIGR03826 family flagellar region protein [Bacillales bacterium]
MSQLANCPNCGQLFVKSVRLICNSCYKKEEEMFETVYVFIREQKNRSATMMEICEATKVPEKAITRFIKEGRLRLADFPNLRYPCEACGNPIRKGKLCGECRGELKESLEHYNREQEFERRKQESRSVKTYFSE